MFRSDTSIGPGRIIVLSKGITKANKELLIIQIFEVENLKAVKHINPLKATGPDNMQANLNHKI